MVISLAGIQLSKHMVWANQFKETPVRQEVTETLGGGILVSAQSVHKGQLIQLTSYESGWLTRDVIEQLYQLYCVAGLEMELILGATAHTVIFAHHKGNAFTYDPISFRLVGDSTDYFKGEMLLLTV